MAGNLRRLALCTVLALGSTALAQEEQQAAEVTPHEPVAVPSAEAAKTTWDYFYKGQNQGPLLIEARLCTEVGKTGDTKFECTVEVPAEGVKANTSVMLWQAWLVPQKDNYEDIMVQVKQGEVVRETKDVKVKGEGWRTRTWTGVRLNKPGSWTVNVVRGDQVLKSIPVKVF
jgi:hypothetical protein